MPSISPYTHSSMRTGAVDGLMEGDADLGKIVDEYQKGNYEIKDHYEKKDLVRSDLDELPDTTEADPATDADLQHLYF